jgi:3-oxoacyl-[acyl-carrier protein] reductase
MRNVIVTGGSRGLGLGIALRLRESGYRAIAVARKTSDELTAAQKNAGPLPFWPCDLAEIEALSSLIKSIRAEFGPIYGLVNNAGIGTSGILANMRTRDVERLVRLNTVSPMLLTKHAVRAMMADGAKGHGGRIVNVSSIVASTGFSGLSVYAATKASLIGFTKSLAREMGRQNVTVNAVAPGFIETPMTDPLSPELKEKMKSMIPLGRFGTDKEIASAVMFLASDEAAYITGQVLDVNGGMYMG